MDNMMAGGNGVVVMTHVIPQYQQNTMQICSDAFQNAWCQVPQPLHRFLKGEPKALGVTQILIGVLQILLGIVIAFSVEMVLSIAVIIAVPFWAGLVFIVSGSLSCVAETNKSLCLVKGSLGMNIASAVAAFIGLLMYMIDLAICSLYLEEQEIDDDVTRSLSFSLLATVKGLEVLLLLFSILEFCISLSTAIFGCKAVCSDSASDMAMIIQQSDPRMQADIATIAAPPMYNPKNQYHLA